MVAARAVTFEVRSVQAYGVEGDAGALVTLVSDDPVDLSALPAVGDVVTVTFSPAS